MVSNVSEQHDHRELYELDRGELVRLVLELEREKDAFETEVELLRQRVAREAVEDLLHERIVEMGLASGPLRCQSAEYRADLARAIRRT